ncbi:iron-containing alcohol dehydrogenase family protein [Anaeromicropila herbilytica]|uniref:Iron-containing alcohol dehydrogenase n=1 Tax=Anaeromicropila herbilytica TaxID=2785025 RepID=A0A7R7ELP3_9FIRM|nr:iron-containing alcohol dehydrogenase family protein [Anaeromicropila herbilytica]BCN31270.1 iron-containing alcohol dehydrogenase [Anaeromicropila herbilytica]
MNLNFYMPTKVIMGEDCISQNEMEFTKLGRKALIVTGAHSAKMNGSLDDIIKTLELVKIDYVIYDKVRSNPTVTCVYEGAKIARDNNVEFIIAIGGGSPMDAGKAIALLACQDIKEDEIFGGNISDKVLPMAFVPTTAGTGSEVTQYSILTNDKAETKTSISSPYLFPTVSFLDAKYMDSLSITTTINTAIDALSHAVEGMISVRATALTNAIAIESIQNIASCFEELRSEKVSRVAREKLLYGSMLAGIVIAHTGTTAVHSMGYSLTYFKDVDHGRANGLLLGGFLEFVQKAKPELIDTMLKAMNLTSVEEFQILMNQLFGDKEEITMEEMKKYTSIAIKAKNIKNSSVEPDENVILDIYKKSFGLS